MYCTKAKQPFKHISLQFLEKIKTEVQYFIIKRKVSVIKRPELRTARISLEKLQVIYKIILFNFKGKKTYN